MDMDMDRHSEPPRRRCEVRLAAVTWRHGHGHGAARRWRQRPAQVALSAYTQALTLMSPTEADSKDRIWSAAYNSQSHTL